MDNKSTELDHNSGAECAARSLAENWIYSDGNPHNDTITVEITKRPYSAWYLGSSGDNYHRIEVGVTPEIVARANYLLSQMLAYIA